MKKQKKHWKEAMNERNQDWIDSREKPKGIIGKAVSSTYRDNWEKIFSNKKDVKNDNE
tara:strand:- start:1357 stop:1530 length:174 start_codon:yes stop_codon:yes gene_type:complete